MVTFVLPFSPIYDVIKISRDNVPSGMFLWVILDCFLSVVFTVTHCGLLHIRKNTLLYSIATRYQVTLRLDCNMARQAHALQHYPAVTA